MPTNKRKRQIRDRMDKTGEPYTVAARAVAATTSVSAHVCVFVHVGPPGAEEPDEEATCAACMTRWPCIPATGRDWLTPAKVLDTLDELIRDKAITPGWTQILQRLRSNRESVTGLGAALDALRASQAADVSAYGPGAMAAYDQAVSEVEQRWVRAAWMYGQRAARVLLAIHRREKPPTRLGHMLDAETNTDFNHEPHPPQVDMVPEEMRHFPWIQYAYGALADCDAAAEERFEAFKVEGDDGNFHAYVPEHRFAEAEELENRAAEWNTELVWWADAVIMTLSEDLRGCLRVQEYASKAPF
ncbi:hypothetical protein [Streptosporangium sp. NPDC048865]|uniref:hypothetical protein n=1 Tax=Streptosporangium sp. NPDC048865 TaxID=3155766 RepID=UPI003443A38D